MVRSFKNRDGLFATVDCSDWEDFKVSSREVLQDISGNLRVSDLYLFRGQSCASWMLESNFDRDHRALSPVERDNKYSRMLALFRENYSAYGEIGRTPFKEAFGNFDQLDLSQVEAIAQHYGLGTRLLDWSSSVYVAAFFAISKTKDCRSGSISIWSLNKKVISAFSKHEFALYSDFYPGNVRNLWQMGSFTRNATSIPDLVQLFRATSHSYNHNLDSGPPMLIRFDIPAASEADIEDDLQMMRINSMTIFPGIEGVVAWIKRKV